MEEELQIIPVDLGEFSVDSLENYYLLCEKMGQAAIYFAEDNPDINFILVYEV